MIVAGTFKCFSILSKNRKRVYWEEFPSTCSKYTSISETDRDPKSTKKYKFELGICQQFEVKNEENLKPDMLYCFPKLKLEFWVVDMSLNCISMPLLCTLVRRISVHYRETAVYLNGLEWITPVKKWSENFMFYWRSMNFVQYFSTEIYVF